MKVVSIDLKADFGFFRKPETNGTLNFSYNMIHKPAILGIMGAIIGLSGYQKKGEIPEYYEQLGGVLVAIEPLSHEKGVFAKAAIKYTNTVGYANKGENFLTEELSLLKPAYRIYLMLDIDEAPQAKLFNYLKSAQCEYIPYFGKNEFSAWWSKDSFREYSFELTKPSPEARVQIKSLFIKSVVLKEHQASPVIDLLNSKSSLLEDTYTYFERLPSGFDSELMQYELKDFAYTTAPVKNVQALEQLYFLKELDAYVHFF